MILQHRLHRANQKHVSGSLLQSPCTAIGYRQEKGMQHSIQMSHVPTEMSLVEVLCRHQMQVQLGIGQCRVKMGAVQVFSVYWPWTTPHYHHLYCKVALS